MKTGARPRILLALAALVMLGAFTAPLWSIKLTAPQYRDGLGMHISISEVTGHDTHDIQNINILNHYIGMKPIEPDAIPELTWMPWILAGLIITGLLVAVIGNRWLMAGWLVAFLGLGVAGMVDFYLWNLDYGHNLSSDAPIKVPGMTYSPPLIGQKVILNITARSYPHIGTLYLTVAAFLAGWAVFGAFRSSPGGDADGPGSARSSTGTARALALVAVVIAAGCGAGPGERGVEHDSDSATALVDRMEYGLDEDAYCGGPVDRVRWGGELRTVEGDRLRFRSVECLAGYIAATRIPADRIASVRVVDFPDGWRLIDVSEATFLRSPNLKSPDLLNLHAIGSERMVRNLYDAYTGDLFSWDEVLGYVARAWEIDMALPAPAPTPLPAGS